MPKSRQAPPPPPDHLAEIRAYARLLLTELSELVGQDEPDYRVVGAAAILLGLTHLAEQERADERRRCSEWLVATRLVLRDVLDALDDAAALQVAAARARRLLEAAAPSL